MAAEHGGAPRNQQPEQPIEAAADAFAIAGDHDRAQQLCLDFGRVLMLSGVLVAIPTAFGFDPTHGGGSVVHTTRAFIGFLLWILGTCMCLLGLTPAAAPAAVRVRAAIASNVLKCLSLL